MIEPEVEVYNDGSKEWYLDNELHRIGGPAIERENGYKRWFLEEGTFNRGTT